MAASSASRLPADRRGWLILLLLVFTAIGLLLAALFVERQNVAAHRAQQRNQVRESLLLLQSRLEGNLRSNILLVRGLVSVIAADPGIDQPRFERAARPLFEGQSQLRNIGAAPDMVLRLMYPLAGNEKAIGLDYRKTPAQFEAAERARSTRALVLAGPLELRQGGVGLVARLPVYLHGGVGDARFWGLISAVIDAERLWRDSGLRDAELPIELALRGKDGKGEAGAVFFGDAALFDGDTERLTLALPHGAWQMAARPRGGWTGAPANQAGVRLITALIALSILAPMLLLVRFDLRQRQAERRLATSEERLSLAVDAAQLAIWDWELATDHFDSGTLALLLGLPREAIAASADALKARMHPEDVPRFEAAIEAHLHDLAPRVEIDFRLGDAHGAWRWLRGTGRIVQRAAGTPLRISGVLQDVTALRAALDGLETARAAAEAGARAKDEFIATMSHEIRTPLNGVLGMADLLHASRLDAERQGYVATLRDSARALLALVNDILDFSKIEAGRLHGETADFSPAALVREVCGEWLPRAAQKGLLLELDCPDGLPDALRGDAGLIRQVLGKLVGNAIKFTQAGRIDVEVGWRPAEADGGTLRLAVRDTGIGISAEAQARLFAPFFQVDNSTTRRYGGAGLGLSIARRLVEAMRGRIGVVSAPGEGACFWFELPLQPVRGGGAGGDGAARLPVLDGAVLGELTRATGLDARELLAMLRDDIASMADELAAACAARDAEGMRRLAHSIKSSCAQLGAPRLSAVARAMELAVRAERVEDCIAGLPALHAARGELDAEIKARLGV
jgi:signal transduction histidine kinase/HPt (histidine-containing phosphotransfer) domain-containing protein